MNKPYIVHVQFEALGVKVTAKNEREAKKKARAMFLSGRRRPKIDGQNLFANEA